MMQCEHIHGNGTRCLYPAMHRRSFCYMHWRQREHRLAVPPEPEFQLPTIDSEASVVLASNQIADAVLAGKLDTKKARVVLACLKMAIESLRRMEDVSDIAELELTPSMQQEFAAEANAKAEEPTKNHGVIVVKEKSEDEEDLLDAARPRAALAIPEGSVPLINELDNVTGFQARVSAGAAAPEGSPGREPCVSVTSTSPPNWSTTPSPTQANVVCVARTPLSTSFV